MAHIDVRSSQQGGSGSPDGPVPVAPVLTPVSASSVWLSDLLVRARLTPAQAGALAADALDELATGWAAGRSPERPDPERVRVTGEGRLRLPLTGKGAPPGVTQRRSDTVAVAHLVDAVLSATSQPAASRDPQPSPLLTALHRASRLRDGAAVDRVAEQLRRLTDAPGSADPRRELAALVTRLTEPDRFPPTIGVPAQRRRRIRRGTVIPTVSPVPVRVGHPLWSGIVRSLALLLTLVIVLGAEYAFLGDRILRDLHRLATGTTSSTSAAGANTTANPSPTPRAVPTLAPAAAGAIAGLNLRAVQPCRPGAVCEVRLQASVHSHRSPMWTRWAFTIVNRCSGATVARPGGQFRLAAGQQQLAALARVSLPPGSSLAVVALTAAPARAAAPPMPVPATGGTCRAGSR